MVRSSVIVPAFNAAQSIARAISSALQQSETRIEVVVIDDASTDATADIVAGFARADARVRLLRQAVNAGPGAARNHGIREARGAWIALLDADDAFAPDRLVRLLALAERNRADVVSDNLLLCRDESTPPTVMVPREVLDCERRMSAAEFVEGSIGSSRTPRVSYGFMQPVFRRDFLAGNGIRYREDNRFGEDYLLALDCLIKGARWWVTPEAMYCYTVRAGSLTEIQTAVDLNRIRQVEATLLREASAVAADRRLARALRRHKAQIDRRYYYRAFTDAVKAGAAAEAMEVLLEGPGSFRDVVAESLHQSPVIIAKALRGGYRSRKTHPLPG